ncbi:TBPIP domain-containing protein [Caenorhabditis elegans]|uniref:TBPIP domain-containing protein n=1 Tax=Caenorhabditis elegans TaxID=6239 RepID=G5EDX0_CAEEL|nr:TBPIP domain-containing protein [Caenorhabditis elegans]CAB00865.2 TBPIP domain-containing protein [Caenorhabditis elegans]|eukprot:NP_510166.2 Uncharacterized protein CELE_K03A11.1 [Caenorhabditis elegans]
MDLHQHLPSYQEADGGAHGKETTSHIIYNTSQEYHQINHQQFDQNNLGELPIYLNYPLHGPNHKKWHLDFQQNNDANEYSQNGNHDFSGAEMSYPIEDFAQNTFAEQYVEDSYQNAGALALTGQNMNISNVHNGVHISTPTENLAENNANNGLDAIADLVKPYQNVQLESSSKQKVQRPKIAHKNSCAHGYKYAVAYQILKDNVGYEIPVDTVKLCRENHIDTKVLNMVVRRLEELGAIERPLNLHVRFTPEFKFKEIDEFQSTHIEIEKLDQEEKELDEMLEIAQKQLAEVKRNPYAFFTSADINLRGNEVLIAKAHDVTVDCMTGMNRVVTNMDAVKIDKMNYLNNRFPKEALTKIDNKKYKAAAKIIDKNIGQDKVQLKQKSKDEAVMKILRQFSGTNEASDPSDERPVHQALGINKKMAHQTTQNSQLRITTSGNELKVSIGKKFDEAQINKLQTEKELKKNAQKQANAAKMREKRAKAKEEQEGSRARKRKNTDEPTLPIKRQDSIDSECALGQLDPYNNRIMFSEMSSPVGCYNPDLVPDIERLRQVSDAISDDQVCNQIFNEPQHGLSLSSQYFEGTRSDEPNSVLNEGLNFDIPQENLRMLSPRRENFGMLRGREISEENHTLNCFNSQTFDDDIMDFNFHSMQNLPSTSEMQFKSSDDNFDGSFSNFEYDNKENEHDEANESIDFGFLNEELKMIPDDEHNAPIDLSDLSLHSHFNENMADSSLVY